MFLKLGGVTCLVADRDSSTSLGMTGFMKLGTYRHFKTRNFYRVIAIAKHSETLEDFAVYECLYDRPKSKIWIRPKEMFLEIVEINGKKVSRFEFVEEEE